MNNNQTEQNTSTQEQTKTIQSRFKRDLFQLLLICQTEHLISRGVLQKAFRYFKTLQTLR